LPTALTLKQDRDVEIYRLELDEYVFCGSYADWEVLPDNDFNEPFFKLKMIQLSTVPSRRKPTSLRSSMVLTAQVANAAERRLTGKGALVIRKACATIRNSTVQRQNKRLPPKRTPVELVTSWLRKIVSKSTWDKEILQQVTTRSLKPYPWRKAIRDHTKKNCDKLWTAYLALIPLGTVRALAQLPTTGYRPQVHLGASKATSSLITQIRTEKIGVNAFIADRHVPDKVVMYTCERPRQTAKCILLFCPEYADERDSLYAAVGTKDYSKMLATPHGAKASTQWLQRTGLLSQFNLGL
jgi:hypothetical protein